MGIERHQWVSAVAAPVLAVVVLGCSDSDPLDRGAVAASIAEQTGWSEREARCWVERVLEEEGEERLTAELAGVDPGAIASAFPAITVDCVDPSRLTTAPDVASTITARPDEPAGYGDDPVLDGLWDACAGGDGAACDRLFRDAPVGSEYERFGSTCGDRGVRPSCAG